MITTTAERIYPDLIKPAHEVRDTEKLATLVEAMESGGWSGRSILAYRYAGTVCALTGSHRIAAARAACLDEIPVLVIEDEMVGDDSSSDILRDLCDLTCLAETLRDLDVEPDALALADAEDAA